MRSVSLAFASLVLVACGAPPAGAPAPEAETPAEDPTGAETETETETETDGFLALPQAGLEVEIAAGAVRGVQDEALRVFRGIPFAEAPIGERRFRAPVPKAAWDGVLAADAFGPSCPQDTTGFELVLGDAAAHTSEDCLSLNVWAHDDDDDARPVMVFIYGGGFVVGGSNWPTYDAARLAARTGAVVVTVNYRLGMLGFLATRALRDENEDGRVGNWGIQDQIEALRWVKQNIAVFGGDADNVTIFGESAGAISVCALLGAPEADELFHKAIIESGMCTLAVADGPGLLGTGNALDGGERLVDDVGCGDAFDPLACLRSLPASDLVGAASIDSVLSGDLEAIAPISPLVDGALIPEQPLARLPTVNKPVIVGSNRDEGGLFTGADFVPTRWALRDRFASVVPDDGVVDELMDVYPASRFWNPKDAWVAFMGEITFICPGLSAVDALASGGANAFAYHFTRTSLMTWALGAAHGLELPYVFGTFDEMGLYASSEDLALSEAMQDAWGSFAHTGAPTLDPTWDAWTADAPSVAILDADVEHVAEIRDGRCGSLQELGIVW